MTTYSTVRLTRPPAPAREELPVTRTFIPFTDDDMAAAVGVRPYLPELVDSVETMTLPRLTAADIQMRTAQPEPVVYIAEPARPRWYRGRRRRPTSDLLRAVVLGVVFVAIAVLPGVLA